MQKKKIINFRPIFYCFISYGFAIVFASKLFAGHFAYMAMFATLILIGFLLAFYKKAFLEFALCAIAITLGFGSFFISLSKYNSSVSYSSQVIVSGTVAFIKGSSSSQQVVLNNLKINNKSENFSISLFDYQNSLQEGDFVKLETTLNKVTPFNLGKFSSYYYNNNIFYTGTFNSNLLIEHQKTQPSLRDKIKSHTLQAFLSVMPKEIAHITYGAMFGDTSGISSDTYSSFRDSGIIHILSVSGMHIVIVVGIVNFFLKKFKLNKYVKFAIFSSFLIFYSYLCSFNVTVVRSCIMSIVLIFGTNFGKRYDMLNAIGLSGLSIILFKPLMIFDIGFQLSFLSVFMIAGFAKPISNFLQNKGVPAKLALTLGTSFAVQIGLFPLTLKYFGQFPFAGTLGNLIAVPIFEFGFVLAFVLNLILMILPFLGFLLLPVSFMFSISVQISNFLASLDFMIFTGYLPSAIIVLFFLLGTFIVSPFLMVSKKLKKPILIILSVVCVAFSLYDSKPIVYNNITVFQASYSNTNSTIFITENENILVSDFKDTKYLTTLLEQARINKLNIVVLVEDYHQTNFDNFKKEFKINLTLKANESFQSKTFKVSSLTLLTQKSLPKLEVYGYSFLLLDSKLNSQEENHLNLIKNGLYFNGVIDWKNQNIDFNTDYKISSNQLSTPSLQFKELNNWYFHLKNGKIDFVRSLD